MKEVSNDMNRRNKSSTSYEAHLPTPTGGGMALSFRKKEKKETCRSAPQERLANKEQQESFNPKQMTDAKVPEEEKVKNVYFAPFVVSISNINEKNVSVDVKIEVSLRWSDDDSIEEYTDQKGGKKYRVKGELCNENGDDRKPWSDDIWTPNIIIDETAEDENDGAPEEIEQWDVVRDPGTGKPMLHMYVLFEKTVYQNFSLAEFPFERLNLNIFFALDDQSSKEAVLRLHSPTMFLDCSNCFGDNIMRDSVPYRIMGARIVPDHCTENWSRVMVHEFKIVTENEDFDHQYTVFSNLELRIDVARKSFYYTSKILSIMMLVMLIGASTFFIPIEKIDSRLAQGITIFLTLVAFQFAVSADLPQLPYLTTLDKVNIITYCLVTLTILENIVVVNIRSNESANITENLSLVLYLSVMGVTVVWLVARAHASLSAVPKEYGYKYFDTWKYITEEELEKIKAHPKYNALWVNAETSPDTGN